MSIHQNAHLTFKGNVGVSRHDWLRLTPAYSHKLVSDAMEGVTSGDCVLDPFAGTGTTGLVAAEMGIASVLLDVNPFLVWLEKTKTRNYQRNDLEEAHQKSLASVQHAACRTETAIEVPPIRHIERWWTPRNLDALAQLKLSLDLLDDCSPADDLLKIAFCRVLMESSNAAFNHQSMSFKKSASDQPQLLDSDDPMEEILDAFNREASKVISSASSEVHGRVETHLDDARQMDTIKESSIDLLYTSPPYANRMSYIRELRPYMYWLGYITHSRQAGEMDWNSIGGTWGIATSRVAKWRPSSNLPIDRELQSVLKCISCSDSPNARTLSKYVHKYFSDMFEHFTQAFRVVRPNGRVVYIVGNSSFYGNIVPTEQWYAKLLAAVGFTSLQTKVIRKRNSKKELYEFEVQGVRP